MSRGINVSSSGVLDNAVDLRRAALAKVIEFEVPKALPRAIRPDRKRCLSQWYCDSDVTDEHAKTHTS
ncbi:hypothetical protein HETIRDRAFT_407882 [Heterobasidion irregulare TC 32-1]|uniref:Uncharacterized protein n=1 Tax=Heterobasidion irregulare (strain TC 32-1) TaxID=747525 RepID=W4KJX7_HETIT|nr:uncharacterized protein HETIRDRAFT_407882 [Heterobasidion irregulare TC 32-1]ETW86168.1 hypothetical protein HETIRDRAFT_407882 [Heterobasidion irregulare TC 32-1]